MSNTYQPLKFVLSFGADYWRTHACERIATRVETLGFCPVLIQSINCKSRLAFDTGDCSALASYCLNCIIFNLKNPSFEEFKSRLMIVMHLFIHVKFRDS